MCSAFVTFTDPLRKRFFWALVLPQIYPQIICTLHIYPS